MAEAKICMATISSEKLEDRVQAETFGRRRGAGYMHHHGGGSEE
jgi:hypothetical protein